MSNDAKTLFFIKLFHIIALFDPQYSPYIFLILHMESWGWQVKWLALELVRAKVIGNGKKGRVG